MSTLTPPVPVRGEALPRGRESWRPAATVHEGHAAGGGTRGGRAPDDTSPEPERLPRNLEGVAVLVVDDDPGTLEYFAAALGACGARVRTTTSARQALHLVAEASPHVIVSDIAMPGEDGYWLLSELRRHADRAVRAIPVVAATAYGREHSRERTRAAGFTDHVSKPVDPLILCLAVAEAVGR